MKKSNFVIILIISLFTTLACAGPFTIELGVRATEPAAEPAAVTEPEDNPVPTEVPATEVPPTSEPPTVTPTSTVEPTATMTPTVTTTSIPCNLATFISDVTIPDGTELTKNTAFTKTWRLKNIGSCAWTSGYQLIFDHGDQMSGPASKQLTSGVVNPGDTVDISVDLKAPDPAGSYRGYWRMRDAGGVVFGLSNGSAFYVDIKSVNEVGFEFVPLPLDPGLLHTIPLPVTTNIYLVADESGFLYSDGEVRTPENVGDAADNRGMQAFLSFDISSIPAGSTISEVKVNFSYYETMGDPFGSLGCLRIYPQNYGTLDSGDYYTAANPVGALVRWCNGTELSNVAAEENLKTHLQSLVGSSRARFRVQFKDKLSDNDGVADAVRFNTAIKLIVKYTAP